MDPIVSGHKAYVDAAVAAIHAARSHIFDRREGSPSFDPRDTSGLSISLQGAASRADEQECSDRPVLAATHFCLASSLHLLEVCRALMEPSTGRTPSEEIDRCKALMFETTDAGRAAYRAALILCELPRFDKKSLLRHAASRHLPDGDHSIASPT
jgi:hypothetical protein